MWTYSKIGFWEMTIWVGLNLIWMMSLWSREIETQIHTYGDHHVNINTETRVMLPQDKGHQRLPANHQKLGKKSKEQTLATPWPQTSSLQTWETVHFSGLSHPFVVFGYVSPIKLIQWIPDNTDVKTIIDISHLEVKPVALCLISAKLLYVM